MIRLMPNLPCVVQEGALLFARGSHAKPDDVALLRSLLHCCGLVEEGPEAWIDIHTGLSGSGVAFVSVTAMKRLLKLMQTNTFKCNKKISANVCQFFYNFPHFL